MSNNDNLLIELIKYEDLTKSNELLNKELLSLSGKNDTDSLARISEIEKLLNENNTKIFNYDKDKLNKVERYFSSEREFRRISNEIKAFENISKEGKEERVEVRSAEGRPKKIYKSLAEKYKQLAEQKRSMQNDFYKEYMDIEKLTTMINFPVEGVEEKIEEIKVVPEVEPAEQVLPESKVYKDLTDGEKKEYQENRIQNIISSGKLPNMGKKSQVMYNGKRYNIPKAYRGQFMDAIAKLNALNKKDRDISETAEKVMMAEPVVAEAKKKIPNKDLENTLYDINSKKTIIMPQKKEEETPKVKAELPKEENMAMEVRLESSKDKIAELINFCNENGIKLYPVKAPVKKYKINTKKAFTTVKNKKSLNVFKKLLPKAFNIDKRVEKNFLNMNNKLLKTGIKIENKYINFKNGVIQKYNSVKNTVTSIPKRTKDYIKGKYDGFKKYFGDKKEISRLRKEDGFTRKDAMEQVYGDKKDKHLDYRIVNRATKFKDDTCQKIKTTTGKIVGTTKAVADTIAKPFRWLRDNYHDDIKRADIEEKINILKNERIELKNARVRVKTNPNMGGYVGTVAVIVMGVLALAGIIFMGIGSLINR